YCCWGCRCADDVGQHEFSRERQTGRRVDGRRSHKPADATSLDHELLVTIWINLECGRCLRAAAEDCYERRRRQYSADLVIDEVPGADPIARGAGIGQLRRTRPSHQLMMRYPVHRELLPGGPTKSFGRRLQSLSYH